MAPRSALPASQSQRASMFIRTISPPRWMGRWSMASLRRLRRSRKPPRHWATGGDTGAPTGALAPATRSGCYPLSAASPRWWNWWRAKQAQSIAAAWMQSWGSVTRTAVRNWATIFRARARCWPRCATTPMRAAWCWWGSAARATSSMTLLPMSPSAAAPSCGLSGRRTRATSANACLRKLPIWWLTSLR